MDKLDLIVNRPLVVGDVHLCEYSSIIRRKELRLSHIVNTLRWLIDLAHDQHCDSIVFLGDFFDKPELNAAELTALQEVKWPTDLNYICLVGNHEMGAADLSCSSTHILNQIPNFHVIDKPTAIKNEKIDYLLLPYIVDDSKRKLDLYCKELRLDKLIVFSHNDIKGMQLGKFISKQGFEISDIENHCICYLNGHLHNRSSVPSKNIIFNVGNILGQNFSEDAFKYDHCAHMLCIDEWVSGNQLSAIAYTNPYAFNFYKIDLTIEKDFRKLYILKPNAILSVRCFEQDVSYITDQLESDSNVIEYRLILVHDSADTAEDTITTLTKVDHIEKFKEYIINELGSSEYVLKELQEIYL